MNYTPKLTIVSLLLAQIIRIGFAELGVKAVATDWLQYRN
jgi:hypothetical protein